MVQMTYNFKDQFVDNLKNTNIYIACFTTSHAGLMLYNKLDYLQEKVLYFDTDSIIYVDDCTKTVKTGDMLGEMNHELSGKKSLISYQQDQSHIASNSVTMSKKSAVKGFTLNHENISLLNHDSLSKIVKNKLGKSQSSMKTRSHKVIEKS